MTIAEVLEAEDASMLSEDAWRWPTHAQLALQLQVVADMSPDLRPDVSTASEGEVFQTDMDAEDKELQMLAMARGMDVVFGKTRRRIKGGKLPAPSRFSQKHREPGHCSDHAHRSAGSSGRR